MHNLELILKVEDSPAISLLALSVDFNPNFLQSGDITISPSEGNLFYNLNSLPFSIIVNSNNNQY